MTRCACGHPRAAHVAPDGDCRSCPLSDPCEGWEPAPAPHPCGHVERSPGCGGCDPGAIEYVLDDKGRTVWAAPRGAVCTCRGPGWQPGIRCPGHAPPARSATTTEET